MHKLVCLLVSALVTFAAGAQQSGQVTATGGAGSAGVSFLGDELRLGVGIDDDGDLYGEYFHVWGTRDDDALIAEGYFSDDRGGFKMNYHWLSGVESFDAAIGNEDVARVRKVFVAFDQNQFHDKKATFGYGSESPRLFWALYGSKAASSERYVGQLIDTVSTTETFTEGNQVFERDIFTDTVTSFFERPYDYGIGGRIGHFYDKPMIRVRGGVDYEVGREDADQVTVSLGVEKYFANTGHSLALTAEHYEKSGDLSLDDSDTRAVLYYRYSFGERYRERRDFVERKVEVEGESTQPATRTERRPVQNRIEITDEAYFDFDRSAIRTDARNILSTLVEQMVGTEIVSKIRVIGHTCNIGTDPYNQGLSERRAQSAVSFLTANGIDADRIVWEGRGEQQPKYSNDTEESRKRNRRVEIEFVSLETDVEDVEVEVQEPESGRVEWVREPITDPAWLDRAMRNTIQHKRNVDTYRRARAETRTRTSDPRLVNNLPEIVADQAVTLRDRAVTIPVLANDSDADGPLRVVSVTPPGNGMAAVNGDGTVTYTPAPGFTGTDEFTYLAVDEDDAEGTATVTVTVNAPEPLVANDDSAQTPFGQSVTVDVLDNDSGSEFALQDVSQGANGTVAIDGDQVTYTPNAGFAGTDTFTYTITDDFEQEATGTVTIEVLPPPVLAVDDSTMTNRNQAVSVDVLSNDTGESLFVSDVGVPANGTASRNDDGSISYTPNRDFVGADMFSYTITNPLDESSQATVTVTVLPFNTAPVAVDDDATTSKNTAVVIDVLANDSDADGDALTIISVNPTMTGFGTVEITADNQILYTPNPGWWGGDEFDYTIDDGFGGQATAHVVLEVFE